MQGLMNLLLLKVNCHGFILVNVISLYELSPNLEIFLSQVLGTKFG